jgi:hypothetical protein
LLRRMWFAREGAAVARAIMRMIASSQSTGEGAQPLLASPGQPRKVAAVASKCVFMRREEQCCSVVLLT